MDCSHLPQSVIAVPPLARNASGIDIEENRKIIRFLHDGGIRHLLYGGNAVFYHLTRRELETSLSMLAQCVPDDTHVVPSIGPTFGHAMDQIECFRDHAFPTVMVLPARDVTDVAGVATGLRKLSESLGKPLVVYLKFDGYLDVPHIERLERDGVISWIKYAVVRHPAHDDAFLGDLIHAFPKDRIVSGIGEQPAIVHMRDFGVVGYTSGCVCIDPAASMRMLEHVRSKRYDEAESIREYFEPLEDLRNTFSPIRVLHHAVEVAGIANTGEMPPLLSSLDDEVLAKIGRALEGMKASTVG